MGIFPTETKIAEVHKIAIANFFDVKEGSGSRLHLKTTAAYAQQIYALNAGKISARAGE